LTTPEADPQGGTTPIELPTQQTLPAPVAPVTPSPPESLPAEPEPSLEPAHAEPIEAPSLPTNGAEQPGIAVRPAMPTERELVYVPLAVNIGDGFKFGCGFFLAMVLALLVGFVLLAALFVLTGLFGLNLPLTR
jgi:hypothetical protein